MEGSGDHLTEDRSQESGAGIQEKANGATMAIKQEWFDRASAEKTARTEKGEA